MATEKSIEKLKEFLEMVDGSLTKKEFVDAFKAVLSHLTRIEERLGTRIDGKTDNAVSTIKELGSKFEHIIAKAERDSESTFGSIKRRMLERINESLTSNRVNQELNKVLGDARSKLTQLSNPKPLFEREEIVLDTPENLRDKLERLEEDERINIGSVKGLEEFLELFLEEFLKRHGSRFVGGSAAGQIGGNVRIFDLSDSLDGSNKTFPLPAFARVLTVDMSSFPNALRPTVDFTTDGAAMTITFTSEIDAATSLAAGQTAIITYAEL